MTDVRPDRSLDADTIRLAVLTALRRVAPDADAPALGPDEDLIEGLGLDSVDLLRVMAAIEDTLAIAIPERAYPACRTRRGMIDVVTRIVRAG